MGRRKKVFTEAEIAERKARWWGEDRNARRRERYANDPAYREKAVKQVRSNYERTKESKGIPSRSRNCLENLPRLTEIGSIREVQLADERTVRMLTFQVRELGDALERNGAVVGRWISANLMPAPIYKAKLPGGTKAAVYTVNEVRAIMEVFSEHQQISQYIRAHHTEFRDKVGAKLDAVRAADSHRSE